MAKRGAVLCLISAMGSVCPRRMPEPEPVRIMTRQNRERGVDFTVTVVTYPQGRIGAVGRVLRSSQPGGGPSADEVRLIKEFCMRYCREN